MIDRQREATRNALAEALQQHGASCYRQTLWLQVVHGGLIPAYVREGFRIAEEERPGPSLLELPEDVAREEGARSRPIWPCCGAWSLGTRALRLPVRTCYQSSGVIFLHRSMQRMRSSTMWTKCGGRSPRTRPLTRRSRCCRQALTPPPMHVRAFCRVAVPVKFLGLHDSSSTTHCN